MFLSIRDMGRRGVNTELPAYELDPNEFTYVNNVRFWDGTASTHPDPSVVVADSVTWTTQPDPVEFQSWVDRDSNPQFAYSTNSQLYRWDAGASAWNLASGTLTSTDSWNSMVFGDTAIFNNGLNAPQMLENGSTNFTDLTAWPALTTCKVIRKFKNFIIGLGVTDGTGFNPNKILWSDEAETNTVPQSWDISDAATLAGDKIISADDGEIVDGLEMGDVFIIYTKRAFYEMSFIGAPYVMAFRRISSNTLLSVDSVVAYDNYHFCIGEREIYIHDGQNVQHIADQRTRKTFYGGLIDKTSVKVELSPITKEIFVIYQDSTTGASNAATKAMIWCYQYDTFTFVDMPGVSSIRYGFLPGSVTSWSDLQSAGVLWSELNSTWAELSSSDLTPTIFLLSDADNRIYQSDLIFSSVTSNPSVLERKSIDLDKVLTRPTNTVKLIKQILPQITGTGTVTFELGCHDTPDQMVNWLEAQEYDLDSDYRVDLFATGRYLAWRITGLTGSRFRMTGMDVDIEEIGER